MAGALDVGTLSGKIEFEDRISSTLDIVLNKVSALDGKFAGMGKSVAATAAGFTIAEVAISAVGKAIEIGKDFIEDFTVAGAGIADVEDNFKHLTSEAGRLGDTLLNELKQGTHGTITDFELLKTANQDLAAGMNLTDKQFRTVADGAFALAQATGGDVATALEQVNTALLTGNDRLVKRLTGQIDMQQAEEDFAASLGTTVDHLSAEGQLEAKRLAILNAVSDATKRLGEQTDGLDEIIAQAVTSAKNFYEELQVAVATSPNVIHAFEAIRDAIVAGLGTDASSALETLMGWVNSVADAVAHYGPIIIDWFFSAIDLVKDLYHEVVDTWDALPDWLKNVATNTALATVGIIALDAGVGAATSTISDLIGYAGNLTTTLSGLPQAINNVVGALGSLKLLAGLTALDFTSIGAAKASIELVGGAIFGMIGPLGIAVAYATALFAAFEIGKWQPVSDFFQDLGLRIMGYSEAERDAMIATDHATQASQKAAETKRQEVDIAAEMKRITDQVKGAIDGATGSTDANTESLDRNRFVMSQSTEEAKKYAEAWAEIDAAGTSLQGTLDQVDGNVVEAVKYYLDAGVALDKLKTGYELTDAQAKAINETWTEQNKILDEQKKQAEKVSAAQKELADTGKGYDDALRGVGLTVRGQIEDYLKAGASVQTLATAYGLTEGQVRAIQAALKDSEAAWAKEQSNLEDTKNMVRTLSGEYITLAEAKSRQAQGGSQTYDLTTAEGVAFFHKQNPGASVSVSDTELMRLAKAGKTIQQLVQEGVIDLYAGFKGGSPNYASFAEGGYGDFGTGTLAMLHGKEIITPVDKLGDLGGVTNYIYVNGTAAEVAKKVSEEIMRTVKSVRKFGSA